MESPEDIEKALAALVPSAISEKGQRSLEDLIDNLAAGNSPLVEMDLPASRRLPWGWIGGLGIGAAAALAFAFQVPGGGTRGDSRAVVTAPSPEIQAPEAPGSGNEPAVVSLGRPSLNQELVRDLQTGIDVVVTCVPAEDRANPREVLPVANVAADTPGLGISMGVLDDSLRAHVPDLPHGFGFLITAVEAGGPYDKAGVKPNDILWMIGDQMIANKAQFLTLLLLHKEGEEVKLGIYRSGKALEIPVILGPFPEHLRIHTLSLAPARGKDGELDMPMKVYKGDTAFRETPDGKAVLTRNGDFSEVRIVSHTGSVIYEGPVRDETGAYRVPVEWQDNVGALERGFSYVRENSPPPRPRRIPVRQDAGDK